MKFSVSLRTVAAFAVAVFSLAGGCGDSTPPVAQQAAAKPVAAESAEPAEPAGSAGSEVVRESAPIVAKATPTPVTDPGPAYFGVAGVGVVRLQDGRFEQVLEHRLKIRDLALQPDGKLWVAAIGNVFLIDGERSTKMSGSRAPGSLDRIDVGPGGQVWAIGIKGVAHYDGSAWTVEPRSALGVSDPLYDVAVDAEGNPWVVSAHHVHTRSGGAWKMSDPLGVDPKQTFYRSVARGLDGALYVATNRQVFTQRAGGWREVELIVTGSGLDRAEAAADGSVHASGLGGQVAIGRAAGGTIRLEAGDDSFRAKYVRALAVDGSGRTWLGTDHGVVVLSVDGGVLAQWIPGTVPELSGSVEALAMVRGGPALPEVGPQAKGYVRGRVLRQGRGVAGAEVELCESPASMFRSSPCDSAVFKQRLVTGPEGGFQFESIPVGTYSFAIRPTAKDQWLVMIQGGCCSAMKNGKVFDVGTIDIGP